MSCSRTREGVKFPPHGSSPESRGSGTRSGSAVLNDVLGATGRPHDERYVCAAVSQPQLSHSAVGMGMISSGEGKEGVDGGTTASARHCRQPAGATLHLSVMSSTTDVDLTSCVITSVRE